jgi:YHS domain-containing protein
MDVDPATARQTVEHNGCVIAFCAPPSCKRQFLADPEAYLIA